MNPKVSVVIPTYNRAAKVREAPSKASWPRQSPTSKSSWWMTDRRMTRGRSLGRLLAIGSATTPRPIRAQAWRGTRELQEARGEWIAFLDSDDLWEKEKLEWQFKALERFGPQCGGVLHRRPIFQSPGNTDHVPNG